jgi:folate-binding protein YgfZ
MSGATRCQPQTSFDIQPQTSFDIQPQTSFDISSTYHARVRVSGAVAFDKGCYIGQELTARTKFRGEVCLFIAPPCFPLRCTSAALHFAQLRQVRKRLFCLEHPQSRAELLKCFNGESALELQLPARASPLYIAGVKMIVLDALCAKELK